MEPEDAGAERARSNVLKFILILATGIVIVFILALLFGHLASYIAGEKTKSGEVVLPARNASLDLADCTPGANYYAKVGSVLLNVTALGNTTWRGREACYSSGTLVGQYNDTHNDTYDVEIYSVGKNDECMVLSSLSNASEKYETCEGDWGPGPFINTFPDNASS